MFFDDFCNDDDGWGPINEKNNDLTPCAQSWLIFAPINFVLIIIGILSLNSLLRKKSSNSNDVAMTSFSGVCNFDFIMSFVFTLAFSHALIISIVLSIINKNDKLNWVIFALSWQLLSWIVFTCLLYVERKYVYLSCEAPSLLVRWYWVVQFVFSLKNLESVLIAKYANNTQPINTLFYIQIFAELPFLVLFLRAMTLKKQESINGKLDFDGYRAKLSMQEISISDSRKTRKMKIHHPKTVEENASLLDILTYGWLSPMFSLGCKRRLEMDDLTYLKGIDHTHQIVRLFYKSWRYQLRKIRRKNRKKEIKHRQKMESIQIRGAINRVELTDTCNTSSYRSSIMPKHSKSGYYTPSLTAAIFGAFGTDFLLAVPLVLLATALGFVGPLILQEYLKNAQKFDDGSKNTINEAYMYSAFLFASFMLKSLLYPQYYHITRRGGMRVRAALMSACYEKTLMLTQAARSQKTAGQILNIITVDVRKLRDVFFVLSNVIVVPFQLCISVYLLYQQIGLAVFIGLASQVIVAPIMFGIGIKIRLTFKKLQKQRDQRMKVVNEVFGSMKIVKMYAWEQSFNDKLTQIRNGELQLLKIIVYCITFIVANFSWSSNLVCLVSFAAYCLIDGNNDLTTEKAFTSIALFNLIRFPLAQVAGTIVNLIDANICVGRIRKFLSANEINPNIVEYVDIKEEPQQNTSFDHEPDNRPSLISLKNAQFSWDDKGHQMALFDISVNFKAYTMTMIVGETGAGKSTLLRGILGNLSKISGHVIYGESPTKKGSHIKIAYSSQVAWIQNETIRNNILFGQKYEKTLFDAVVNSCALEDDLKMFAAGDQTEIGEKGITLSGGQKQRISLARAIYSKADVYIFDDPLSAVDAQVANHIFDECFIGLLKHKTIILATHAVSFLKYADNILVMEHGAISLQGQLQDLINAKINLTKFVLNKDCEEKTMNNDDEKTNDSIYSSPTQSSPKVKSQRSRGSSLKGGDVLGAGDLIEDEKRETGGVSYAVYWLYVKASGGAGLFFLYILFLTLLVITDSMSAFWLSFWSSGDDNKHGFLRNRSQMWYLEIYALIQLVALLFIFIGAIMTSVTRLNASRYLYQALLNKILRAPMSFFDTTPVGRIINRFSRDINGVDLEVPMSCYITLRGAIQLTGVMMMVAVITPYFILILIPLLFAYYYLQKYYITACRELKRLSTLQNSPIYSHFSESIAGVDVIRAFGKIQTFSTKTKNLIDRDHIAYYPSIVAAFWLSVRLQFIGNCLVGSAALLCALMQPPAGYIGISLSTTMGATIALAMFVQSKTDLEQNIVSVERIDQYSGNNAVEEKPDILPSNRPYKHWPQNGSITFNNVFMKYRPELDYVLKGLTFRVKDGEKIGVIGRTGAGKSSIFVSILRLVEIESELSQIVIDGVDVATIGLRDLRERVSVIPQDPVLFTGTVRFNLDPFQQRNDNELIESLKLSHCYDAFKKMIIEITIKKEKDEKKEKEKEKEKSKNKEKEKDDALKSLLNIDFSDEKYYDLNPLDIEVEENGSNFSVGQRQLLCLARAIVRKSRILLLDEATSAVDPHTDQLIQETIRQVFKENTILTISHRIDTILDYDRILIIDNGKVLEFNTPKNLLSNKNSKFADIVKASFGVDLQDIIKKHNLENATNIL